MASIFVELHANGSSNSLILSLTHLRSKVRPARKLEYYYYTSEKTPNAIEPLKEIRDGHIMSLSLGSPPQTIHNLLFSTGSDLVALHCGSSSQPFECIACNDEYYKKYNYSFFNPSLSNSISSEPCTNPLCANIHDTSDYYDTCTAAGCKLKDLINSKCSKPCPWFSYSYVDGAVAGVLAKDTIVINANNQHNTNQYISFGCVRSSYRMLLGLVGFGKGPLSLPSQLGFSKKGFSHCFLPFEFSSNPNVSTALILGDLATSSKEHLQFTQLLDNPRYPYFYYIGLESVTVGNKVNIPAPESLRVLSSSGKGGVIIDSATSNTHLPGPLYSDLLKAIKSMVKYSRALDMEAKTAFHLCYRVPKNNATPGGFPSITFHFLNNVSLELPPGNLFYKVAPPKKSLWPMCLIMQKMDDDDAEASAVFGSFQQQNIETVYDLQKKRIGFQPTDCVSYGKRYGLQMDIN
ncbi:Eukaryotic aspartyl protease family protein [Striga hermonthica]|uniref:Eukaryotic aspartyl protease family protein n=1 Tax=Striga hermonthica TaxID=68872 RepID=A0A9N7N9I3_STRHE|nr:Eukaryotic aspartyl protease family protein [Striga hermonthica]